MGVLEHERVHLHPAFGRCGDDLGEDVEPGHLGVGRAVRAEHRASVEILVLGDEGAAPVNVGEVVGAVVGRRPPRDLSPGEPAVEGLRREEVHRVDTCLGGLLDNRPGELLLLVPLRGGRTDDVGREHVQPRLQLFVVRGQIKGGRRHSGNRKGT